MVHTINLKFNLQFSIFLKINKLCRFALANIFFLNVLQELLDRKADYCDHLLSVAAKLCPGAAHRHIKLTVHTLIKTCTIRSAVDDTFDDNTQYFLLQCSVT